ncbi:MAG: toxic anion resistance protein [Sphingomicrobium sp.]
MASEAPTETKTKLKLDPPEALQAIAPAEAVGLVPLKVEETSELDSKVAKFVDELAALDSNSPEFGKKVDQLTAMGRKEIAEAAGASNRFLDRPVKAIDKDTGIGADLTELRRTVESLDPKEATKTRKLLGIIPFGNRVDRYFDKYRSSQTHISKILGSLANGKDELLMDNAAIDTERANLWKTMHKLEQMIHISKALDPKEAGRAMTTRKFLGIIPFGNRVNHYFDKYRSSQTHISAILNRLANGKDELLMDNAAIDTERASLWKTMHKLEQMIHISKTLDKTLEDKANELDATDPAKAKAIRETALFYTRQRTTDLLTQMAVTVQGYLALDLVKKNNVELVKGVDRASTTTVSALRTAVTVASAMSNQRLVLEQIGALNTTTANMIDTTGELLKTQSSAIHEQAASSTIPLETLQRAFQNIYDTMDSIDAFKLAALANMKQTVATLGTEVEKSKGYIARAEGVAQGRLENNSSPFEALESK